MAHEPNQVTGAGAARAAGPDAPPYPEGTSAEQIRRDIERTRAEMDQTVDALQERLRPRHLLDDLVSMFSKSSGESSSGQSGSSGGAGGQQAMDTAKQIGSKVLDKLKQHPIPAALIGAGITWLLFEGDESSDRSRTGRSDYRPRKWDVPEHSGSYVDARTGQPYAADYGAEYRGPRPQGGQSTGQGAGGGPGVVQQAKDKAGDAAGSVKDAVTGAAQSVKDAASSAADKVSEWAGSARESAGSAGHAMRDSASATSEQARRGYEAGKHYLERGIEEYPLAMGAAAMALGVLSGLLLPHTRTEDRWMGEQSDDLKRQAKDAGREVVERGKHVAAATASAATDEAGQSDVSAGSLVEKVKHVVQDVKEAATESARREGLDPASLAHKGQQIADRAKDAARDETQRQKEQANL